MASPSCPPLLSLSPARSHRSTNHSVKWKGTELPVCGEGEDSPRVLTSRSAGMGVGDPGTGESGRSPGKAHSEGRGKETKRKGKHKQQQKKQRVGAPTRVAEPRQGPVRGGCEAGSVHPRGGARDARGRNCTVVRNAAIGKGRRGPGSPPRGRRNRDERRDPRRGGREEAPRRAPSRAGLSPRAGPPGVPRAPRGHSAAHGLTFKEVVVLVVAGAHGAAEELRGGRGGGDSGGTRGRRCRGNPSAELQLPDPVKSPALGLRHFRQAPAPLRKYFRRGGAPPLSRVRWNAFSSGMGKLTAKTVLKRPAGHSGPGLWLVLSSVTQGSEA